MRRFRQKHYTLCGRKPRAWTELASTAPIVIRFHYPCGYTKDVAADRDPKLANIAPALLRSFASSYWSQKNGGVEDECPRCRRAEMKKLREEATC